MAVYIPLIPIALTRSPSTFIIICISNIYIYVYIYIYIYKYTYKYTYIYMYIYTSVHAPDTHLFNNQITEHLHNNMYVSHIYTYVYIYICTYIHI